MRGARLKRKNKRLSEVLKNLDTMFINEIDTTVEGF